MGGQRPILDPCIEIWRSIRPPCPTACSTPGYGPTCSGLLHCGLNKLCAWRHNMPPPPASLTIISCKYENRQRLQFTTEFAKRQTTTTTRKISTGLFYQVCTDTVKAKHSRIWAQAMHFCPSNKLTFDLLTLKVVPGVTCDVGYLCANFSLPRPLARCTRETNRRQTDVRRQTRIIA